MNQSADGTVSGRMASDWLVDFKVRTKKPVYVLASHSHFYMSDIFNTPAWLKRGAPLPGLIVGTAGAIRYALPPNAGESKEAKTGVYGHVLATVDVTKENPITFEFHELVESDVPKDVVNRFTAPFVHDCWVNNSQK